MFDRGEIIMAKPTAVKTAEFQEKVLNSDVPVVVDFWAPWCPPCRAIAPILEDLAKEYDGKLSVAKVNVDDEGQLAMQYGIQAIPVLIMFKGGQEVGRVLGARPKGDLKVAFEQVIQS
jgi:thioredoxin 1